MIQSLNKGEVWLANLNPSKGAEPGKTRPVLIIQDQALLDVKHPSTLIIPLTTNLIDDASPLRIRVNAQDKLKKDSDLLIDQIRAIDNKRLTKGPLTVMTSQQMELVYIAVCEVMGVRVFN
jgi:mRNA interferase MazF